MKLKNIVLLVIAMLTCFLASVPAALCADDKLDFDKFRLDMRRMPLKGIKSLNVRVAIDGSDEGIASVANHGVTEKTIKNAVELKLRSVGIKIEENVTLTSAGLIVALMIMDAGNDRGYFVSYEVYVLDSVILKRQPALDGVMATTWNSGGVLMGPPDSINSDIRSSVIDKIEYFANDYLAVNPKK